MLQIALDSAGFRLSRYGYRHVGLVGVLMLIALLIGATLSIILAITMWKTYAHEFTLYLKWQDAVVALLGVLAFMGLGASIFVMRFLFALRAGYTRGMILLQGAHLLAARDLSIKNYGSIGWIMHAAFWLFVVAIVGLMPGALMNWTLHLPNPLLAVLATILAALLCLGGLVLSIIAIAFLLVGCVGVGSDCRQLGRLQTYELSSQTVMRIDDNVLTITNPSELETMLDLDLLTAADRRSLLALLYKNWIASQQSWNPTLGQEIEEALSQRRVRVAV